MIPCSDKKRTGKVPNPIRCYVDDRQKKEIEARWQKLMTGTGTGDETRSPAKTADVLLGAKVIRRRKGQADAPVSRN